MPGASTAQEPAHAPRPARPSAGERQRILLLLTAAVGGGIGLYFALPVEPDLWLGPLVALLGLAAAYLARERPSLLLAAGLVSAFGLGLGLACWETARVSAPILERPVTSRISGRLDQVERLEGGARVVFANPAIEGIAPEATPVRVRVRLTARSILPAVGDRVTVTASLSPPPAPASPGGHDFGRGLFFQRIGAVGFAVTRVDRVDAAAPLATLDGLAPSLRLGIRERLFAAMPARTASVALALITGERREIPEPTLAAIRDSGLAHLLSVSGLHISLVAGLTYFLLRAGLALNERLALTWRIRRIAAAGALLVAIAQTWLVGAPVPTLRALLMAGLALGAVMLDRSPFTLRLVALAALVILVLSPHELVGPSFQLSFAAVTALIAFHDLAARRGWARDAGDGLLFAWARSAVLLALSSLVATLATAPYSYLHFQNAAVWGVAANMLAIPLTGTVVMPAALAACLAMPLGLDAPFLWVMGWGVDLILVTAHTVAAWPGAVARGPPVPAAAVALVSLSAIALIAALSPRWWIFPLVIAALVVLVPQPRPLALVSGDGRLVALRAPDGGLILSSTRTAKRVAGFWLEGEGLPTALRRSFPDDWQGLGTDAWLRCDPLACLWRDGGRRIAVVSDPRALEEDCLAVDAVIALVPLRVPCPAPVVIEPRDLARFGAHSIIAASDGLRLETVAIRRGRRPWTGAAPAPDADP